MNKQRMQSPDSPSWRAAIPLLPLLIALLMLGIFSVTRIGLGLYTVLICSMCLFGQDSHQGTLF